MLVRNCPNASPERCARSPGNWPKSPSKRRRRKSSARCVAERELAAAERAGALLRIAPGLVLLPDAEQRAVERLAQLPAPFTLSQARKALRTTRRVAVPLLEHLARRGRTERLDDGTHRVVSAAGQAGSLMTNGAPAQGRR